MLTIPSRAYSTLWLHVSLSISPVTLLIKYQGTLQLLLHTVCCLCHAGNTWCFSIRYFRWLSWIDVRQDISGEFHFSCYFDQGKLERWGITECCGRWWGTVTMHTLWSVRWVLRVLEGWKAQAFGNGLAVFCFLVTNSQLVQMGNNWKLSLCCGSLS